MANGAAAEKSGFPVKGPHLALAGTVGAGGMIGYLLVQSEPKLVIETFRAWGAPAFLGLVALILIVSTFKSWGDQMLAVSMQHADAQRENAVAQARVADAVNLIAQKDDERAREMELVVDALTRNSHTLLQEIREVRKSLAGMREKAPPGGESLKSDAHS